MCWSYTYFSMLFKIHIETVNIPNFIIFVLFAGQKHTLVHVTVYSLPIPRFLEYSDLP